jgi:hypothetical protein
LGVSVILDGWMDTRHMTLVNVIISSPKGAMFMKADGCSGEVKDSDFIAEN